MYPVQFNSFCRQQAYGDSRGKISLRPGWKLKEITKHTLAGKAYAQGKAQCFQCRDITQDSEIVLQVFGKAYAGVQHDRFLLHSVMQEKI